MNNDVTSRNTRALHAGLVSVRDNFQEQSDRVEKLESVIAQLQSEISVMKTQIGQMRAIQMGSGATKR